MDRSSFAALPPFTIEEGLRRGGKDVQHDATAAWDLESHSPFLDRAVRGAAAHPLLSSASHARGDDNCVPLLAQSSETCRAAGGASGGEGDASWQRCVWQISNDDDDGAAGGAQSSGLALKKRKSAAGDKADKPRRMFGGLGGAVIETREDAPAAPLGWYVFSAAAGTAIGAGGGASSAAGVLSSGATSPLPLRFGGTRKAQERGGGSSGSGS